MSRKFVVDEYGYLVENKSTVPSGVKGPIRPIVHILSIDSTGPTTFEEHNSPSNFVLANSITLG